MGKTAKIILLLGLCFTGLYANAQSAYSDRVVGARVEREDILFSAFVGGIVPQGASSFAISGTDQTLKWGDTGVQYGVSAVQFVNSFLGFGVEVSGANTSYDRQWVGSTQYQTATSLWNGMVLARLNINPYNTVRLYVPMGFGLTYARNRWQTEDTSLVQKSVSYGYMVGVGAETNVYGPDKSIGLEVRYNGFGANLDTRLGGTPIFAKNRLDYVSVLIKLNYKF